MSKKFVAAAALAALIGTGMAPAAFAQDGQPKLGAPAAEQAAPKASDKAATKVQHGGDKAKSHTKAGGKAQGETGKAKGAGKTGDAAKTPKG